MSGLTYHSDRPYHPSRSVLQPQPDPQVKAENVVEQGLSHNIIIVIIVYVVIFAIHLYTTYSLTNEAKQSIHLSHR